MKTIKLMPLLTAVLLVMVMASCGPSYVGVGTTPPPPPGYYGPRPYYGYSYGPRPYYRRPPVIVQRRTYVVPRYSPRYNNRPSYNPNARAGGYGNYRGNNGRSRGPR
ncbi:hypothetical protein [Spirosoma knui]